MNKRRKRDLHWHWCRLHSPMVHSLRCSTHDMSSIIIVPPPRAASGKICSSSAFGETQADHGRFRATLGRSRSRLLGRVRAKFGRNSAESGQCWIKFRPKLVDVAATSVQIGRELAKRHTSRNKLAEFRPDLHRRRPCSARCLPNSARIRPQLGRSRAELARLVQNHDMLSDNWRKNLVPEGPLANIARKWATQWVIGGQGGGDAMSRTSALDDVPAPCLCATECISKGCPCDNRPSRGAREFANPSTAPSPQVYRAPQGGRSDRRLGSVAQSPERGSCENVFRNDRSGLGSGQSSVSLAPTFARKQRVRVLS